MFRVSLSAYQAYQRCEQSYAYSYVERLRPLVKDVAPQRGIVIHDYLATYYDALRSGLRADAAHGAGLAKIESKKTEFDLAASLAFTMGREDDAIAYKAMYVDVLDLARRYFGMHGRSDAERYDVLLVEERSMLELTGGIESMSIIDLVLRDRITGRTWLVEHKSTATVPESSVRLRDFQTLLYAFALKRKGQEIDGVLWNYIRTKPPMVPELLKSRRKTEEHGGLTRRVDLDTNWETYEAEIRRHGLDASEYADVRERLLPRESTVYFPRFEHVIVADTDLMLRDYATTAVRMRRAVWEWENKRGRPVRSLRRDCDFCQYKRLCEAVIMGGDESDIMKRQFRRSGEEKEEPGDRLESA